MNWGYSQGEPLFFPIDSFNVTDLPVPSELQALNGHSIDWRGIVRNGEVAFFDEYEVDFFGDTLPIPLDDIHERINCRIGGGRYHFLQAHNGWYIGTNRGEWGGELYKLSTDFETCERICRANVNQLYSFREKIYLLEGLSHKSISGGNVIELNENVTLDTLLRMDETPRHLVFISNEEGYLLTDSSIYSITTEMETTLLYQNHEFLYLYPNNLIIHEGILYVPMRGGILMIFTETKTIKWLTREE